MKWAFSLSEDRIQTILYAFNRRVYGATSVSPTAHFTEGTGPLREKFPTAAPSMPTDLAGMAGEDPFESQWSVQSNYYFSQPGGARALDPSTLPDSNGPHVLQHHNMLPVNSSSVEGLQLRTWDSNPWPATQPGMNSIPESKRRRLSPEDLEAHQQQAHRVSPPSATSSGEFHSSALHTGVDAYPSAPYDVGSQRNSFHVTPPQWDNSGLIPTTGVDQHIRRNYSDSNLHGGASRTR
jgi:hypothetical protein